MLGSEIIADADVRVPNPFGVDQKIAWLNEINNEFFEIVKIPATASFVTVSGQDSYPLSGNIRTRNIFDVVVGTERFRSLLFDNIIRPGMNYYDFNEQTGTLTLMPAPSRDGLVGRVRYYKVPGVSFTSSNYISTEPDSPKEFHWIYVLGLCERIAKAQQDVRLAQNFEQDYHAALIIAQQNVNLSIPEPITQPPHRSEG